MFRKERDLQYIIVTIIAGIFFIVSLYWCNSMPNKKALVKTKATITKIKTTDSGEMEEHEVFIKYEADGEEIETVTHFYSKTYHVGKKIKIYYEKDNPYEVYSTEEKIVARVFNLLALFMFIGCPIQLVYNIVTDSDEKMIKFNKNN